MSVRQTRNTSFRLPQQPLHITYDLYIPSTKPKPALCKFWIVGGRMRHNYSSSETSLFRSAPGQRLKTAKEHIKQSEECNISNC